MNILSQLKIVFVESPASLLKLNKESIIWSAIYSVIAILVFGLLFIFLISHQDTIKSTVLDYLFPKSWQMITERLANFLFESQTKIVLSNMVLSGSLVMSSIFLFPIKEKYSAVFEKCCPQKNQTPKEYPLIIQFFEETKLFFIYLTVQSFILWLGYYPYQWVNYLSIALSYLFLFFTFGLDFISPTLQRHREKYSRILKLFLNKPVLIVSFGFLFSLPSLILSHYIFRFENLTLIEISSILFLFNIVFLTLAVPAGTHVALRLLPQIQHISPIKKITTLISFSAMLLVLISSLFLHSQLILSLHHKSQLLKASYSIDWSSTKYTLPSFSQVLSGQLSSKISFDVTISNPTSFNLLIEKSKFVISKKHVDIANIDLNGFNLGAGEKKIVNLSVNSELDLTKIKQLNNLFDNWRVDYYIEVYPGIPFIINITEG